MAPPLPGFIRDGPAPFKSILHLIIGCAIRCSHERMPLQKVKDHSGYWLPYVSVSDGEKYLSSVGKLNDFFLSEFIEEEQLPKKGTVPEGPQESCTETLRPFAHAS